MYIKSRICTNYILMLTVNHYSIRHYIFKDRVSRNNVWNLGYGENLDIFWLGGGKPKVWGRGLLGGTEGVEDIMVVTLLHFYYGFFTWQIIKNAVVKHQLPFRYALVLQTAYFDLKHLVINCRIIFQTIPQRYVHNLKRNWKNLLYRC